MAAVTESDLKELKDLIIAFKEDTNNQFTRLEEGQADLKEQLTGIDKRLAVVETRLDEWRPTISKIPDLAEKVGELKNWKQIGLVFVTAVVTSIFSGTIGGVIGWVIRSPRV